MPRMPSHGLRYPSMILETHFGAAHRARLSCLAHQLSTCVAQDVYTEVAALVREKVAADAATGNPWAPLLHDAIDRKLVRNTLGSV
jgi:DNA-dependent RNA polymerase